MRDANPYDGDGMTMVFTCFLVLLFAPVVVLGQGQETLFLEDFDDPELAKWHLRPDLVEYAFASFDAHDGYGFLNLSGIDPDDLAGTSMATKIYSTNSFLYAGVEMRVRLSSSNKLEGDIGGGARRWGFRRGPEDNPQYSLSFRCSERSMMSAVDQWYPENPGEELVGFGVISRIKDGYAFLQRIEGVDLTEWHTYTILWQPEVATFLIDDVVVAMTSDVPQVPMSIYLRATAGQNLTRSCHTVGQEEICSDEYMQFDYIRVFTHTGWEEGVSENMLALFSQVDTGISEAEGRGNDVSRLRDNYASLEDIWGKGSYPSYGKVREALEGILTVLGAWDGLTDMFSQANATIQDAEQLGADTRTIKMMKGYYSQAERKWCEYDIENTKLYLQKILDMPEPALLSLLGLVLHWVATFRMRVFWPRG